ncbi:MAG: hypothetical protein CVU99_02590 [Firmicutes bacterium HGW-Firmicutes-4]|nr:MAG: hypothetical protein CVU99_02590 [Firmicutes bacterium HGW-Firmicutes-4]
MEKQNIEVIKKSPEELQKCKNDQVKLWEEKSYPDFAPRSGKCYRCGRDIYQNYLLGTHWEPKISNGHDGKTLVTGCPHCHRSFCD